MQRWNSVVLMYLPGAGLNGILSIQSGELVYYCVSLKKNAFFPTCSHV